MQSHTVSIINSSKNKVTTTITANPNLSGSYRVHDPILRMPLDAKFPLNASLIVVNDIANMIYITDIGSDTVSMVDGKLDGVVERTNFDINHQIPETSSAMGNKFCKSYYFLLER